MPHDHQAKPYKNNPEILAMTNLVQAYQNDDITEFEKILRTNRYMYMKCFNLESCAWWFYYLSRLYQAESIA